MASEIVTVTTVQARWQAWLATLNACLPVAQWRLVVAFPRQTRWVLSATGAPVPWQPADAPADLAQAQQILREAAPLGLLPPEATATAAGAGASYVGLPIVKRPGEAWAVLEGQGQAPWCPSSADRALLAQVQQSLADALALAQQVPLQEALHLSEERFRLLVDNAIDDFFLHDDQGRILDVSAGACRTTGYSREALLRMSVADISIGHTQEAMVAGWARLQPGMSSMTRAYHRRRNGAHFPVEVRLTCYSQSGQKVFLGMVRDISEQVGVEMRMQAMHAELELRVEQRTRQWRETTEVLQSVLDSASDAIFLTDMEGRFLLYNLAAERAMGWPAGGAQGRTVLSVLGMPIGASMQQATEQVLRSGESASHEELCWVEGEPRIFLTTRSPRRDLTGKVIGMVGIGRDITDRKQAEAEFARQGERLALAAEVAGLGILDYREGASEVVCNAGWRAICGRPGKEPSQDLQEMYTCIHPDDRRAVRAAYVRAVSDSGSDMVLQCRVVRPSGEVRWVSAIGRFLLPSAMAPGRLVSVIIDITERELAQRALEESYESLRSAERMARIGSWSLSAATGLISCSDNLYDMLGLPQGVAFSPSALVHMLSASDYNRVRRHMDLCLNDAEAYGTEVTHIRPDGSQFVAHVRGQPKFNADGNVVAISGTFQDVSEREEVRAQLSALADHLPSGALYRVVQSADDEVSVGYVSAGIEPLLGVAPASIMTDIANFYGCILREDRFTFWRAIARARRRRGVFEVSFRVRTPFGRIGWMQCRAVSRPASKDTVVWDGLLRDVTVEHAAAEVLRQAKVEAEAAGRAKGDFLAMMSHEIRTPLNSVLGMTRLALQTDLDVRQRGYLDKIEASGRTLLGIIDDVLDYSRIEAGGLVLEDTLYGLDDIFEAVANATALRADEKGLNVIYAASPEVPRRLRGDALRLSQVLINLVGNAVKFTDEGEVVVSVVLAPQTDGVYLRFAVSDTGIGLTPEVADQLFLPFAQGDSRISRRYGGTGLGLSICRQLVQAMGGQIGVQSTPGAGSTFHFTLPLRVAFETASSGWRGLEGERLLIVDDNATARSSLAEMASSLGLQVASVPSGERALATLRQASLHGEPYDLVLMDWRMPGMDGLATARRIRADASLRVIPAVLLVTTHGREIVHQSVEHMGIQGLLIKPVTESMLFEALQQALRARGVPSAQVAALPPGSAGREVWRGLAGHRVLVVDDNALNREVVSEFLGLVDIVVDAVGSAREALDALRHHRYDAVLMDVHMPDMDGLEATRQIREEPAWEALPIIALTAQARIEDREASLQAGMTAHLTKPIDEHQLFVTLADVLDVALVLPSATPTETEAAPELFSPGFDRTQALRRLGHDPARYLRLLSGFLRDFSGLQERLPALLAPGRLETLITEVHTIRGAAGYLQANALVAAAAQLEQAARTQDFSVLPEQGAHFLESLAVVLAQVRADIADSVTTRAVPAPVRDTAPALAVLARLRDCVTRGDYAAVPMVADLLVLLAGHPAQELAVVLQEQIDDLETDAAAQTLMALQAVLSGETA